MESQEREKGWVEVLLTERRWEGNTVRGISYNTMITKYGRDCRKEELVHLEHQMISRKFLCRGTVVMYENSQTMDKD